jgi:hypothetical protein
MVMAFQINQLWEDNIGHFALDGIIISVFLFESFENFFDSQITVVEHFCHDCYLFRRV